MEFFLIFSDNIEKFQKILIFVDEYGNMNGISLDKKDRAIVYARGESVQVFFDYKSGKTFAATSDFMKKVSSYVEK